MKGSTGVGNFRCLPYMRNVTQTNKYIGQFLASDFVYTILPCLNSSHPISTRGNSTSVPVPNQMELSP